FIPTYIVIGKSNIFFICRFNNHAHWSILPVAIRIKKPIALLFILHIDNHVMGKRKCTTSPYGMPVRRFVAVYYMFYRLIVTRLIVVNIIGIKSLNIPS